MLKANNVLHSLTIPHLKNERSSSSTATTQSQCLSPCDLGSTRYHGLTKKNYDRAHMFRSVKNIGEISQKLIEKAITWIQITGYTKKFNFDTIILTITLFYASLGSLAITKKNLESTICACILLASKMTTHNHLTLSDILALIENRQNSVNIREQEKKILQALDYNIHFQLPIHDITLTEEQSQHKFQLLIQILLIKQPSILCDEETIQAVMELCEKGQECKNNNKLRSKLQKIVKKNNCEHLINKYQGMFNVRQYLVEIEHISDYI